MGNIFYFFIIFWFECIILIHSIAADYHTWPRFYEWGESTEPTEAILSNLTYYREEWEMIKAEEEFDESYAFVFAWDCSPCPDECYAANKFIIVEDDEIKSLTVAQLNDDQKLTACDQSAEPTNISDYNTIDELYELVIDWVSDCLEEEVNECKIIELMLHKDFLFPMAVKLSRRSLFRQWDIPCFQPGQHNQEDGVCLYSSSYADEDEQWTFWITEEMQSFLGWSMIFLIIVACSLGYCINWLKKKKSEKIEAWREKEERARQEKERQKQAAKEKKKKARAKRRNSRSGRMDKSRRNRPGISDDHDHSAEELLNGHHYDVMEEEHKHDDDD